MPPQLVTKWRGLYTARMPSNEAMRTLPRSRRKAQHARRFAGALSFLSALLLSDGLAAQRTWIVSETGQGDFKELASAFRAAKDGDTVIVRGNSGTQRAITNKGLTLLGENGARMQGLTVQDLKEGSRFVAKGLQSWTGITLRRNKGSVHLEDIRILGFLIASRLKEPGLAIESCRQVSVTDGAFTPVVQLNDVMGRAPGIRIADSTVYLTGVRSVGLATTASYPRQPTAALVEINSHIVIARGSYQGGAGIYTFQHGSTAPAPGLQLIGGDMTVAGDVTTRIAAGELGGWNTRSASAIDAQSATLRIDPTVTLVSRRSAPKISGSVNRLFHAKPTLEASGVAPGGTMQTDAFGAPGAWSALYISVPGVRTPLAFGDLWLDLGAVFLAEIGPLGRDGRRRLNIPIHPAYRRGTALAMQALQFDGRTLELSTPVTVSLH